MLKVRSLQRGLREGQKRKSFMSRSSGHKDWECMARPEVFHEGSRPNSAKDLL